MSVPQIAITFLGLRAAIADMSPKYKHKKIVILNCIRDNYSTRDKRMSNRNNNHLVAEWCLRQPLKRSQAEVCRGADRQAEAQSPNDSLCWNKGRLPLWTRADQATLVENQLLKCIITNWLYFSFHMYKKKNEINFVFFLKQIKRIIIQQGSIFYDKNVLFIVRCTWFYFPISNPFYIISSSFTEIFEWILNDLWTVSKMDVFIFLSSFTERDSFGLLVA